MRSLAKIPSLLERGLGWTARLLAAGLVCLILVIYVGEGGINPLRLTPLEVTQKFFFLTACVGMVAAWRWPLIGGAIATAGIVPFFAVEFAVTGGFPRGLVFHLMLLPGPLFMLSGFRRPERQQAAATMKPRTDIDGNPGTDNL